MLRQARKGPFLKLNNLMTFILRQGEKKDAGSDRR